MKISKLLKGHHSMLEKLLNTFFVNIGKNFELMSESLDELKRGAERHFSAEEKQVFGTFKLNEKGIIDTRTIKRLIKEHDNLLEMLNDVKSELAIKDKVDVSEFRDLLAAHRRFEERYVYPKLDKKLSKEEQKAIIDRISGIL
jgi:hemerythrin superfamily protein